MRPDETIFFWRDSWRWFLRREFVREEEKKEGGRSAEQRMRYWDGRGIVCGDEKCRAGGWEKTDRC
jgi:hypothetical protein